MNNIGPVIAPENAEPQGHTDTTVGARFIAPATTDAANNANGINPGATDREMPGAMNREMPGAMNRENPGAMNREKTGAMNCAPTFMGAQ